MFRYRNSLVVLLVLALLVLFAGSALAEGKALGKDKNLSKGRSQWGVDWSKIWTNDDDDDDEDEDDKDLLGYVSYKKGKDASWGWAIILMVRAAGLEDEADQADPGSAYRYVPSNYYGYNLRKYLKVALDYGVIGEKEVRKFDADKPVPSSVLRDAFARIAWMLMNDGSAPPVTQPVVYEGVFISLTNGNPPVLAIKTGDGQTRTFNVSTTASIKYQNQTIAFSDLRAGDTVNLKLAGDLITEITITARATTQYTGTITALQTSGSVNLLTLTTSQQTRSLALTANAEIKYGNVALYFSELLVGDSVTVELSNNQVTRITVAPRAGGLQLTRSGTIVAVNGLDSTVTVNVPASGSVPAANFVLKVDSQTSIVRSGSAIGFADLHYGQAVTYMAKLVGDQWKALTIQVNN